MTLQKNPSLRHTGMACLLHFVLDPSLKKLQLFVIRPWCGSTFKELIKELIKVGWPLSLQMGVQMIALTTIVMLAGWDKFEVSIQHI